MGSSLPEPPFSSNQPASDLTGTYGAQATGAAAGVASCVGASSAATSGTAIAGRGTLAKLALGNWPDIGYLGDPQFHGPKRADWHFMVGSLKYTLFRLQELEYVAPRFGRMGATLKYELLIDADEPSETAHIGLLDVEKLRLRQPTLTGPEATLTPPCQTPLARLSPARAGTSVNLATLPARASGPLAAAVS